MPSQHSKTKQAVTFRLPRDLVDALRAHCEHTGEQQTALVERVVRQAVTPPPPQP